MSPGTEDRGAEALLQHASWVQRLARSLVAESTGAEDLVQDTWVAALDHRPATDRSLRPWLGAVLRNLARRSRRRPQALELVGEPANASESASDPADVCGGVEAARVLTDEVAKLEEPYRSTLFLRYYRDLSPVEIARSLGIPPATVRSRLKRGIERLRESLDGRFDGNRGAWCALLVPLIRSEAAVATSVTVPAVVTTGILAMNALLRLGAAIFALVLSYLGLIYTGVIPDTLLLFTSSETPVEVSFRPIVPGPQPAPTTLAKIPDLVGERRAVESAIGFERPAAAAAPPTTAIVEAALADLAGKALAGARLRRVTRAGPRAGAVSGPGGHVRLEVDLGERETGVVLEAFEPGFASHVQRVRLSRGQTVRLGTILLEAGGSISGMVVDEDGRGIEGAVVNAGDQGGNATSLEIERYQRTEEGLLDDWDVPRVLTDRNGAFTLAGLGEGYVRIWAEASGRVPAYTAPVEVRGGQDSFGVEVVLVSIERANSIAGRVVDPDGKPVPFATLEYKHRSRDLHFSFATSKDASEDGSFRFVLSPGSVLTLTARDPEERYGPATAEDVETGTSDLALQLTAGPTVDLVVRGAGGNPVEAFEFEVLTADDGEDLLQEGACERGAATIRIPVQDYLVRVTAPMHEVEIVGPLAPRSTPELLEVRLVPVPGIHGRVVASDSAGTGSPVAGAKVRLHRLVPDSDRVESSGFRCWLDPHALEDVDSDVEGRFLLTAREPGDYAVTVEHPGHALAQWGPFTLGSDLRIEPLAIALGAGGAIEGRVYLSYGEDPTGTLVGIHRCDGRPRTVRVGEDGRFRFELLTPGPWSVEVRDDEVMQKYTQTGPAATRFEDEVEWSCEVVEGQTTFHDLRPVDPMAFRLEGRIEIEGVEAKHLSAWLAPEGEDFFDNQGRWTKAIPDPEGYFRLGAASPGVYFLALKRGSESEEWLLVDRVLLDTELVAWELELTTGSLEIAGIDPSSFGNDLPPFVYLWKGRGELWFVGLGEPDARGICALNVVPAGNGALARPNVQRILDPETWEVLREVAVPRGETVRIQSP